MYLPQYLPVELGGNFNNRLEQSLHSSRLDDIGLGC